MELEVPKTAAHADTGRGLVVVGVLVTAGISKVRAIQSHKTSE